MQSVAISGHQWYLGSDDDGCNQMQSVAISGLSGTSVETTTARGFGEARGGGASATPSPSSSPIAAPARSPISKKVRRVIVATPS